MESTQIFLNQIALFERAVQNGLPEGGDITFITKDVATMEKKAAVCITFTVQLPNGDRAIAQAVTTVACLLMVAAALSGRYTAQGELQPGVPA